MLAVFLLSSRSYSLTVNDSGITIAARLMPLFFIKTALFIPAGFIRHIRTNRIAGVGGICSLSLSLGISPDFKSKKLGSRLLINRGISLWGNPIVKLQKFENTVSLWNISVYSRAGTSPTIFDLLYIEKVLQNRLRLIERDEE